MALGLSPRARPAATSCVTAPAVTPVLLTSVFTRSQQPSSAPAMSLMRASRSSWLTRSSSRHASSCWLEEAGRGGTARAAALGASLECASSAASSQDCAAACALAMLATASRSQALTAARTCRARVCTRARATLTATCASLRWPKRSCATKAEIAATVLITGMPLDGREGGNSEEWFIRKGWEDAARTRPRALVYPRVAYSVTDGKAQEPPAASSAPRRWPVSSVPAVIAAVERAVGRVAAARRAPLQQCEGRNCSSGGGELAVKYAAAAVAVRGAQPGLLRGAAVPAAAGCSLLAGPHEARQPNAGMGAIAEYGGRVRRGVERVNGK
mmetsp:Transcript_26761/g.67335  ORF Transcript_26761/g.67335 Transcript_26761/m.67335 type:complete len:328 (+) Transcript_26761:351-1334(+)